MENSNHLKGRTALVTGASRGIGRAIALRLAQEGANVVFNYLKNKDLAISLKKEIESFGVRSLAFKVDIREFEQVQEMKDSILEEFGTFDILVNNAGIIKDAALAMLTEEDWDSVIDTNLKGTYNATKAAIVTFMKQKRGDIVNITSVSGIIGLPRQTNYSASKGGIISFTKSLAKEVAPFNIRVNAVAPGFIETDMLNDLNENYLKTAMDMIPLARLGKAEEVAGVVNFLLSEGARYITGQVIQIDGGLGM
jgi:3-oxoacyl-[acyl-carrier protein] reductase